MPRQKPAPVPVIVAAGPRDAEERLLRFVENRLPGDLDDLNRPVRIVVPSRSLRRHVLRALARRFGALVGVTVQTQRALALEVLQRAGLEAPPGGGRAQDLLVRVLAAREDVLQRELGRYDDGAAMVAAAVRDLIDAGFTPEHLEPVAEAVSLLRSKERDRAQALLRVAAGCQTILDECSWAHRGTAYASANERLKTRGGEVLPSRGIVIYGFAETTGLLADLFETLVASLGAVLVIDRPPDPVDNSRCDAGWVFTSRLVDRLVGPGSSEKLPWLPPDVRSAVADAFAAPGLDAEVREIATRIRAARQEGTSWESIGVVFRRLDAPVVAAVRRHFTRLGIPFSGEGSIVPGGRSVRRASAFAELLSSGSETRTEAWLGCLTWADQCSRYELDLAFRAAGAARLRDVGRLEDPTGDVFLPIVERLEEVNGDLRRRKRVLAQRNLDDAVRRGRSLVAVLESRPGEAPVGELLDWVRSVVTTLNPDANDATDPIHHAVTELETELPSGLPVAWRDLAPLLEHALERVGLQPLGGEGGGVQVLSVTEARERTFDHLYLGGLNRGVFPARPVEDPVMPTTARRAIPSDVLPDMPLKARDSEEERYLFAQLMAAAQSVTVSWRRVDEEGKESNPSVFLERLRLGGVLWWKRGNDEPPVPGCVRVNQAPDIFGDRGGGEVRPALEHAVVAGLSARSKTFGSALAELSAARANHMLAVLEELDPSTPKSDVGPFLGVVGLSPPSATPVTRLEQMAACPWQTFLERELGLAPPPEAAFAEEGLSGRIAGLVVHEVLESVATMQGVAVRQTLDSIRWCPERTVLWPDASTVEHMVREVADRIARQEGVPSLAPAIAAYARPLLERAEGLAWPEGERNLLGVEIHGQYCVTWIDRRRGPRTLEVRFRADTVGRDGEGDGLVLVDYKTGAVTDALPATVLPRGRLLQGAVYALAAGGDSVGRYISVADPEKLAKGPVIDVDVALAGDFEPCAGIILGSWDTGVLFPRVSTPSGSAVGGACGWCRVKTACLLGEPGVKRRLIDAFGSMSGDSALRQMWNLPVRKVEGGS